MRIAFGEREVELQSWAEQVELDRVLEEARVDSLIVGDDTQGQRAYHAVTVYSPLPARTKVRVGVIAGVHGIPPKVLLRPGNQEIWIGFNSRVVVVDAAVPLIRHAFELDSVFYQFLPIARRGMTLLIHEIGVTAVSDGGEVVWAVATDVISGVRLSEHELHLSLMDEGSVLLDPATGKRLESPR